MAVRAALLACAISAASCFNAPTPLGRGTVRSLALSRPPMVTSAGRKSPLRAPRMSDMSDMTIEMLKRVEKNLDELPETELIRLQTVCAKVAAKVATLRTGTKSAASTTTTQQQIYDSDEDSDAYYGIGGSSSKELEDSLPSFNKRPASRPQQASQPPPTSAPVNRATSPPASSVKRSEAEKAPPGSASKYIDLKPIVDVKTATYESVVDDDVWTTEYVKTFGSKPNLVPLIDDETPRPPPREGEVDGFAKIRLVQANAKSYATPQDYMDALNNAISEWKAERSKRGELAGAVVSDRYIDQLTSMKGGSSVMLDSSSARKFTLDSMLAEENGVDANGNERKVLVFTSVDPPGSMGMAGVLAGDALLEVNGAEVHSYADLRAAMAKIHSVGELSAEVVIQRQGKVVPERIRVSSK